MRQRAGASLHAPPPPHTHTHTCMHAKQVPVQLLSIQVPYLLHTHVQIPTGYSKKDLSALFGAYGTVREIFMMKDKVCAHVHAQSVALGEGAG